MDCHTTDFHNRDLPEKLVLQDLIFYISMLMHPQCLYPPEKWSGGGEAGEQSN